MDLSTNLTPAEPITELNHYLRVVALDGMVSEILTSPEAVLAKLDAAQGEELDEQISFYLEGDAVVWEKFEFNCVSYFQSQLDITESALRQILRHCLSNAKAAMIHLAIEGKAPSDYNEWDLEAAVSLGMELQKKAKGSEE